MAERCDTDKSIMIRVSKVSVAANVFLSAFKLFAGVVGHSGAMIADAVHSLSDVAGSGLVILGAHLSSKESDREHQYGHERLECVISLILANVLLLVAAGIGIEGIRGMIDPQSAAMPGMLALIAAVVSVASKEVLYWYTRAAAKKIDSVSLMAEAWHHRSDAISSVGSFIGIFGAMLGFPVLQPAVCVLIAVLIFKVGIDIYRETMNKLIDKACDDETAEKIKATIVAQEG